MKCALIISNTIRQLNWKFVKVQFLKRRWQTTSNTCTSKTKFMKSCNVFHSAFDSNFFSFFLFSSKEHQKNIQINGARSENYRSIEWTKYRVDELWTMYTQEPLSMQCNRSDGYRFDNVEWEGSNITPVTLQLPVQNGKCENYNPFGVIPLEQGKCGFLGECIY